MFYSSAVDDEAGGERPEDVRSKSLVTHRKKMIEKDFGQFEGRPLLAYFLCTDVKRCARTEQRPEREGSGSGWVGGWLVAVTFEPRHQLRRWRT